MDKSKLLYIFGGSIALASGIYLYITNSENKKKQQFEKEKEQFIKQHSSENFEKALRELKVQIYPLFFQIASMFKLYLQKEMQKPGNSEQQSKEAIHEILQAEFTKMVKQKEKLIYQKYNLNYDDVDQGLNKYYKSNKNLQDIYQFIMKNIQNCTQGIPPSLKISKQILEFATEIKVIRIWKRIQINNGKKLVRFYNTLKEKGVQDLSINNNEVFRGISNLNLTNDRDYILELEGFSYIESEDNEYQESAMDILQKCCQYYKEQSNEFAEIISRLEDIHENLTMLAMDNNRTINESDVDKFYAVLGQYDDQ